MKGNSLNCDLTPPEDYSYDKTVNELEKDGFVYLGEGGFGSVMANGNCVIKLIKDVSRCGELTKEKEVYSRIMNHTRSSTFFAKFPRFNLYKELTTFCHFNIQKIFSPLTYFGDPYEDEDYGHGTVITEKGDNVLFVESGKKTIMSKDKIYALDKPGSLIHFYINHFDSDLKEKLDNGQGMLLGRNHLEKMFTPDMISIYCQAIGELLAFLIFDLLVIPNDIEVVLGTRSMQDRVVVPYIYDFNECEFYKRTSGELPETVLYRIAKSMYNKNGKNYFPDARNPYYKYFEKGFGDTKERKRVLELYLSEANKK